MSIVITGFAAKSANSNDIEITVISENLFRLAEVFVWLVFIHRLKVSFNGTKYQSSKYIYYIFYILIIIFIIGNIVYNVIYSLHHNLFGLGAASEREYDVVAAINLWSQAAIDLILTVGLTYLYSNKLYRLNMDIGMSDPIQLKQIQSYYAQKALRSSQFGDDFRFLSASISMDGAYEYQKDENSSQLNLSISFNEKQQKVLGIMSKLTLLSTFAIVFTQFIAIYIAVVTELYIEAIIGFANFRYWCGWLIFLWSFSVIINALCVFLSFDFQSGCYYKICGAFDKCCFVCCKRCISARIKHHVIKKSDLEASLLDSRL